MSGTPRQIRNVRRQSINSVEVGMIKKANVQHRSDLLMNEHIQNVQQAQFELHSALQEMESANSAEDLEKLRIEVAELKAHSQKMVLALQVMDKINKELAYARNDLNDALHKGIGDINAARKRVIWLEDKMGELCGKKRLKSRRPSNRFVTDPNYGWETDSEGEQTHRRIRPLDSTERMYASDQNRHQSLTQLLGSEIGFTSDSEHMIMSRHVGFQDHSSHSYESQEVSTSHTGMKAVTSSQEDVSFTGTDGFSGGRAIDHRKYLHDSMLSLTSTGHAEIAEESASEKFSTVKEMSVITASPVKRTSTPGYPDDGLEVATVDDDRETTGSRESSKGSVPQKNVDLTMDKETSRITISIDINQDINKAEEEEEEEEEEVEQEEEKEDHSDEQGDDKDYYEEDGSIERGGFEEDEDDIDEENKDKNQDEESNSEILDTEGRKSTFMTEIEASQEKQAGKIVEGEEEASAEKASSASSHHDIGAEYWQSEHHRFEYSDFADILTQLDPLSYHQMGLAVPGSFIQKEDTQTEFTELPWRPRRKGSDIKDIHRIALDKLAVRMHGMCDKVYNAAMLSVRQSSQLEKMPKGASVFQSFETGRIKPGSSSTKASDRTQTAPAALRQKTEDKLPLPMGEEVKRGGTFVPGRLIFYPKPIPPPQVLPITRTSLNKEFPQFASSFAKPEPEVRKPAERLVDQRNLMEETKLVLYREKIKPSTPGPTRLERKFRKMLEKDRAASNKSSGKKIKAGFKTVAAFAKMQTALGTWNQIKPESRGNEYSGLRWERVKTIVHMNLPSERVEERIDAARQLGILRCGDTMVFYALKNRLHNDPDDRVRYEAAKSLILIGCWEDEILQVILKFLVLGNTEIRGDIIQTLTDGKNAQYVDKKVPSFLELVKVLSHFCQNPDPDDIIAFNSAICLGRLCVRDENARARLISAVKESKETQIKAKGLEILVKQLTFIDDEIVDHVLLLLEESPVWKYRALSCRLLISLGPKHKCVVNATDRIYGLLERKLWDDPSMEVRLAAAKALTALGMFAKACGSVELRLEDVDEEERSQAAISVGTLGMKSEKIIRLLLEMLELDSSDYVRLMIIRTFGTLRLTDKRVLRSLHEREKLDGPLARESRKALKILDQVQAGGTSKSMPGFLHKQKPFTKKRVLSPISVAAV